jgi:hypothetical protein
MMQNLVQKWSLWVIHRNMPWNINLRKRTSAIIRKMMRISQGNNMRRINKSITMTRSWTNKRSSRSMLGSWVFILTHKKRSQGIDQEGEVSCWAHECSCYEKSYDQLMSQALKKAANQILTRIKHTKSMGVRLMWGVARSFWWTWQWAWR